MPGVMIIEALAQAAGILRLRHRRTSFPNEKTRFYFVGIDKARFRKPVEPGDQLILTAQLRARAAGASGSSPPPRSSVSTEVAHAEMMVAPSARSRAQRDRSARASSRRRRSSRRTSRVGPFTRHRPGRAASARAPSIGPHVVINGPTTIGADNQIFQFASIGDAPQDKKYKRRADAPGDRRPQRVPRVLHRQSRHRRTIEGVTRIGNDNLFMAYSHVAHDCLVGDKIVFANCAALGGHVRDRRLGDPGRPHGGASVLQDRRARLPRRRRDRHARRAALRHGRGQSGRAALGQLRRPEAPRLHARSRSATSATPIASCIAPT